MVAKNGSAKVVGVIGNPISHSLSPALHEYWLQQYDINGAYIPLKVPERQFRDSVNLLKDCGFCGFNITLPFKRLAYDICDSHDKPAAACRAVNTIVVTRAGLLHGMNTDVYGFQQLLHDTVIERQVVLNHVVVLGAGGAARAVCYALQAMGCGKLTVANRTVENAREMLSQLSIEADVSDLQSLSSSASHFTCIVNTLSVDSNVTELLEPLIEATQEECVIVDISYGRDGTGVTQLAAKSSRYFCDGLKMLIWQAVPGFEQWFGVLPDVNTDIEAYIRGAS